MPIKRKLCKVGNGIAIFVPKSWLELLEQRYGPIRAVAIEVNEVLKVMPITREAVAHE